MTVNTINYHYLFDVLPDPVVLFDRTGTILDLNLSAQDCFKTIAIGTKIESLFIEKRRMKENVVELLQVHKVVVDKALVIVSKGLTKVYEYKLTVLSEINDIYLIAFNELAIKNDLLRLEIEQQLISELHTLRPYLNKTGKELADKNISLKQITTVFDTGIEKISGSDLVHSSIKEKILAHFTQLTNNELDLAYLWGLGASVYQISKITHKNTNAVRVMLHRLVARTNSKSSTDLKYILEKLLKNNA